MRIWPFVALYLLFICSGISSSSLPRTLIPDESVRIKESLLNSLTTKGSLGPDIRSTYLVIDALRIMNETIPSPKNVCNYAQSILDSQNPKIVDIYQAVNVLSILNCGKSKLSESLVSLINKCLSNDEELVKKLFAAKIAAKFKDDFPVNFNSILNQLIANLDDTGFSYSDTSESKSAYLAAELLDLVSSLKFDNKNLNGWKSIKKLLLNNGNEDESSFYFSHPTLLISNQLATYSLLKSVEIFASTFGKKVPDLSSEKIQKLANFFITNTDYASIRSLAVKILAFDLLNNGPWKAPIIITLKVNSKYYSFDELVYLNMNEIGDYKLSLIITDIYGQAIQNASAFLSYRRISNTPKRISSVELHHSGENVFKIENSDIKAGFGTYRLQFSVKLPEESKFLRIVQSSFTLNILSTVSFESLNLYLRSSDSSKKNIPIDINKKGINGVLPTIEIKRTDLYLESDFQLSNELDEKNSPSQLNLVLFRENDHGLYVQNSAIVPKNLIFSYTKENKKFTSKARLSKLTPGNWTLSLIIADEHIENSFEWPLINVKVPSQKDFNSNIPKGPYQPLPVIEYKFEIPEKNVSDRISTAFYIISLVPFSLFIIGILYITGFSLPLFPSGMNSLLALAFHLFQVIFAYILYHFWIENFFMSKYTLILALSTIIVGNKTLRKVAENRIKLSKSE